MAFQEVVENMRTIPGVGGMGMGGMQRRGCCCIMMVEGWWGVRMSCGGCWGGSQRSGMNGPRGRGRKTDDKVPVFLQLYFKDVEPGG